MSGANKPKSKKPAYAFADMIAPVSEETFFADYYGKKPLHIPATKKNAARFGNVMPWDTLNTILNMTGIWSGTSLLLVLDKKPVDPADYCRPGIDRNNVSVMQPDPAKVHAFLARGATLVCNDIDTLTADLRAIADTLENTLDAKVQGNLYCSWKQRQGFDAHFDTHDVFAVHVEGEKMWNLYEGCHEAPIAHPRFRNFSKQFLADEHGPVMEQVLMRPGDLLYIPRGWYHDALASSEGTVHIAFGATSVIGLDLFGLLYEAAVEDPLFRTALPRRAEGEAALRAHLGALGDRLGDLAKAGPMRAGLAAHQDAHRYDRGGFDLPAEAANPRLTLTASDFTLKTASGGAVLAGPKGAVPVPPGNADMVAWVLDAGEAGPAGAAGFTRQAFDRAFPKATAAARDELIDALIAMKVLAVTGG